MKTSIANYYNFVFFVFILSETWEFDIDSEYVHIGKKQRLLKCLEKTEHWSLTSNLTNTT